MSFIRTPHAHARAHEWFHITILMMNPKYTGVTKSLVSVALLLCDIGRSKSLKGKVSIMWPIECWEMIDHRYTLSTLSMNVTSLQPSSTFRNKIVDIRLLCNDCWHLPLRLIVWCNTPDFKTTDMTQKDNNNQQIVFNWGCYHLCSLILT